jgi:hypothetical protein
LFVPASRVLPNSFAYRLHWLAGFNQGGGSTVTKHVIMLPAVLFFADVYASCLDDITVHRLE